LTARFLAETAHGDVPVATGPEFWRQFRRRPKDTRHFAFHARAMGQDVARAGKGLA
jgi:hypothetical protein